MTNTFSTNWIVNRNHDLKWFLASCLSGYILLYLHIGLGISVLILFWVWIMTADGPHVFATLSRTYLDRQEWQNRSPLLLGSLLWFLLGPLLLAMGIYLDSTMPFFIFLAFAQLWAYWHVVRQHYGFLVMYQKKNNEPSGKDNFFDYWIFYLLMLLPFFSFLLRHPDARPRIGLPDEITSFEYYIVDGLNFFIALSILTYVGKEIMQFKRGEKINLPKSIFLLSCIPFHLLVFLHPTISTTIDIRMFVVFITFYHNIQYHGIVWFYNRNRYRGEGSENQFGLASKVSNNFLTYYIIGILFTIAYRYPNWFFAGMEVPFLSGVSALSTAMIGNLFTVSDLAIVFWWGFAFNHYYLDQKIWKLSKDRQLIKDLKLT